MRALHRWLQKRIRHKPYPPKKLLRLLRLYPPIFLQRIVPISISDDFLTIHIKILPSLLTRNLNGTTFGGTLLSAVDMWYGTLLWQKCLHEQIPLEVWVERLDMRFIKAAHETVYATFHISPERWSEIRECLTTTGKGRYDFTFELYTRSGEVCAVGQQTLYVRNLALRPRQSSQSVNPT
ncbi:MAG: DUF4442 domain-containing protein [Bacteroidia bacterium]|nr:DUF4442 domain-containing protein [Bacteroidia bacterium]